jgi:lipopolysaccharide heptosyltransferase II
VRILLLKPSSLGDVVQAIPVLRLLKRHLPQSEIYWWLDSQLAPLLQDDPDLTGVVPFDRRRWAAPSNWLALWRSVRWMRRQAFDWVIDLQGLARSGAFAWLANGKLLTGLDEAREGARGFYDLIVSRASFHTHAVDYYLAVLARLGVPRNWNFEWLPPRPAIAAALRNQWTVDDAPWLVLQPGARWLNKRWPVEHFVELVRHLATLPAPLSQPRGKGGLETRFRIAILGGFEDRPLGAAIASAAPERCLDLTGRLTLPEMIEWIRMSTLMITNDTGPMHVAAALGKPVVAIFGPTEPRRTGPYGQLEHVLQLQLPCSPCLKSRCAYSKPLECLRALTPASVSEAVRQRLGSARIAGDDVRGR